MDFGKFEGANILIMFDSYSKWVEANSLKVTDAESTINSLIKIFVTFGFPEELVTDNGPPFAGEKFSTFCKENNVKHTLTPPYHSQSNGSAERAVQVVKKSLKKQLLQAKKSNSAFNVETALLQFLFSYRNTPCSVTNKSPAELVLRKIPKSKITDLNPIWSHSWLSVEVSQPTLSLNNGDVVLVRTSNNSLNKWQKSIVESKISNFVYRILVGGSSRMYHTDHIKKCLINFDSDDVMGKEVPNTNTSQSKFEPIPNEKSPKNDKIIVNARKSKRTHKPKKILNL